MKHLGFSNIDTERVFIWHVHSTSHEHMSKEHGKTSMLNEQFVHWTFTFFRLIGSCIPMLVKSYIWGIKMVVLNRCIYIFQTIGKIWWIFCHLEKKYLEKLGNFCFHNVHLRKNVEDFEKKFQGFETLKLKKKS